MHSRRSLLGSLAILAWPVVAKPDSDKGKGKGKGKGKPQGGSGGGAAQVTIAFGIDDRRMIVDYFHPAGSSGLPPGLAKRGGDLPPGLEKQLRRNGTLPPGLQKKLIPFPGDLQGRLGSVPVGYRRVTLGTWALLIQDTTNVILDIIDLTRR